MKITFSTRITTALSFIFFTTFLFLPQLTQAQVQIPCYTFQSNLGRGHAISQNDAYALTNVLVYEGFWNPSTLITTYNSSVASAVTLLQNKYAKDILVPYGLKSGTGYFGGLTRAKVNTLYGCTVSSQASQNTNSQNTANTTATNQDNTDQTIAALFNQSYQNSNSNPNNSVSYDTSNLTQSDITSAYISLDPFAKLSASQQYITTTGNYGLFPALTLLIVSYGNTTYLTGMQAKITVLGGQATKAYLYSNNSLISTATVANGTALFSVSPSAQVPIGGGKSFTVKLDLSGIASTTGASVTADVNYSMVSLIDGTQVSISATGDAQAYNHITYATNNNGQLFGSSTQATSTAGSNGGFSVPTGADVPGSLKAPGGSILPGGIYLPGMPGKF